MPLTDAKLRALKPKTTAYKVSDFDGLHILVGKSGTPLWRLAYRFNGKQKILALGAYPQVSLSEARSARERARALLRDGKDPSQERKAQKQRDRVAAGHTFQAVADEWFAVKKDGWAPSYASRLRSRLDADLMPELGHRPIASIRPIEVLDAIRKIEKRDAIEMGRRVMQMASSVFRYGVATERCERDPTFDLRGALKPPKAAKTRSALPATQLPEFLAALDAYSGEETTKLALQLIVLTFVRSAELRNARWEEFEDLDGQAPLWRIPAARMKMRRAHLVPLASQAVAALDRLRAITGRSEYLFPAATLGKVMSDNTMIYALYRMGYHGRATVHGFRSTASTVLNEHGFNRDWIEMQLAHAEGSVRSIYNAAEWLPGRREMMGWWADYLDRRRAAGRKADSGD